MWEEYRSTIQSYRDEVRRAKAKTVQLKMSKTMERISLSTQRTKERVENIWIFC